MQRSVIAFLLLLGLYSMVPSCTGPDTLDGEESQSSGKNRETPQTAPGKNVSPLPLLFLNPKTETYGYRDPAGKVQIPARYVAAGSFSPEGIAAVADEQGWSYIDTQGRVMIRPLPVDNGPDPFQDGLARFRQGGKVGFFNRSGTVVIPATFDFAMPFREERAAVCSGCGEEADGEHRSLTGGAWGYIDRKGSLVIPLRFQAAEAFENGRARVRLNDGWYTLDPNGGTMKPAVGE